jgi:hypothetical protein
MAGDGREQARMQPGWPLAICGQFTAIFAIVALSGPGRIDIVDGQTRYEVARSLVEHGDSIIRDPDVWFPVFPGRDGRRYTPYRLPQSAVGVVAIVAADHTGPIAEGRRQFFFTLTSAVAAALLALTYSLWFRWRGQACMPALAWSSAGIFCTPSWFYGTSTFDDILGAAAVVGAVVLANAACRRGWGWALASGLALGWAFNCKQPLGVFVLPMLALIWYRQTPARRSWLKPALLVAGLAAGVAVYKGYDWYKYPPEAVAAHASLWADAGPVWTANPIPALLSLTFSPGAGVLWYCPTLLITLYGLAAAVRRDRAVGLALVAASAIFLLFHCFLAFYKGDPSWGPRYLTPMLALWWLWAPDGAAQLPRRLVATLLAFGVVVQLLALSVDPQRLHLERAMPSAVYAQPGWLHFDPAYSHLLNRPREIGEICSRASPATAYTPAPSPTFATPCIRGTVSDLTEAIRQYQVFASLRPWWVHQQYLPPDDRPVDLAQTVLLLAALSGGGLLLMAQGCWISEPEA